MYSLLVIGGSGFFGKSILDAYKRGILKKWNISSVIIYSRNSQSLNDSNPELLDDSISLVNGDISCCKELPRADYVIHAAASADASRYLLKPLHERENIISAVRNYCNVSREVHRSSKIIYVSSGAVYGVQPSFLKCISEEYSIEGDINDIPLNKRDYSAAKRESEAAFKFLGDDGLNVSIARCFAFVGRYLPLDKHFAIGNFIADGLVGRDIKVSALCNVYRSYMFADDLVIWLMTIADSANPSCPIYNVGSDQEISIDALAKKVAGFFSVDVNIISPSRAVENIDRYIPCIEKAKTTLGLAPWCGIDESIEKTIAALYSKI